MAVVICDIDGTIANNDHRAWLISGFDKEGNEMPKRWDSFYEACDGDKPHGEVCDLVRVLRQHYMVLFWSGRMDKGTTRQKTWDWLRGQFGLSGGSYYKPSGNHLEPILRMRPNDDFTPDHELKRGWLHSLREKTTDIAFVLDDRKKVVDMWREEGLVCLQVAPGDF